MGKISFVPLFRKSEIGGEKIFIGVSWEQGAPAPCKRTMRSCQRYWSCTNLNKLLGDGFSNSFEDFSDSWWRLGCSLLFATLCSICIFWLSKLIFIPKSCELNWVVSNTMWDICAKKSSLQMFDNSVISNHYWEQELPPPRKGSCSLQKNIVED